MIREAGQYGPASKTKRHKKKDKTMRNEIKIRHEDWGKDLIFGATDEDNLDPSDDREMTYLSCDYPTMIQIQNDTADFGDRIMKKFRFDSGKGRYFLPLDCKIIDLILFEGLDEKAGKDLRAWLASIEFSSLDESILPPDPMLGPIPIKMIKIFLADNIKFFDAFFARNPKIISPEDMTYSFEYFKGQMDKFRTGGTSLWRGWDTFLYDLRFGDYPIDHKLMDDLTDLISQYNLIYRTICE